MAARTPTVARGSPTGWSRVSTGSSSTRPHPSFAASSWRSSSATATITSRSSSPRTRARVTAAADRRGADAALLRADATRRRARRTRRTSRDRRRDRARAARGGSGGRAGDAPAHRRAVHRAAWRRARGAGRARAPERRVRAPFRLLLRRVRGRPHSRGAPARAAGAARTHARGGAARGAARALPDREGPVDPDYLRDLADLVLRFLHVVAGIAWIGASFYFIRLDLGLAPPGKDADEGVAGEYWGVHGGGFYHSQKYRVAPRKLPEHL